MLKTTISSKEFKLTDAIIAAVEKKIAALDKYLATAGDPREMRVEVFKTTQHHKKGDLFEVIANLRIAGKLTRAEAISDKLYTAIDSVKDQLKREISKKMAKNIEVKRDGARRAKRAGTETELV